MVDIWHLKSMPVPVPNITGTFPEVDFVIFMYLFHGALWATCWMLCRCEEELILTWQIFLKRWRP